MTGFVVEMKRLEITSSQISIATRSCDHNESGKIQQIDNSSVLQNIRVRMRWAEGNSCLLKNVQVIAAVSCLQMLSMLDKKSTNWGFQGFTLFFCFLLKT